MATWFLGFTHREGHRRTGGHGDSSGAASRTTTNVAAQIIITQNGNGRVVVGVLPDVLVLATLRAICREVLEYVYKDVSAVIKAQRRVRLQCPWAISARVARRKAAAVKVFIVMFFRGSR